MLTLKDGNVIKVGAMADRREYEEWMYEITTEYGSKRVVNGPHPLEIGVKWSKAGCHPIIQNYGWTPVDTFKNWLESPPLPPRSKFTSSAIPLTQDSKKSSLLIAMPDEVPIFGNTCMQDYELAFLAYMIGDGCVNNPKKHPHFCQLDNDVLKEWKKSVNSFGDSWTVNLRKESEAHNYYVKGVNCKTFLSNHDVLGKDSYQKVIPECIYELPKGQLAFFLNRLYSTDGWISTSKDSAKAKKGYKSWCTEIGYCSVSEEMCRQIQRLLLRFGIHAKIRERKINSDGRSVLEDYTAWCVDIHDSGQQLKFLNEIGIYGRQEKVDEIKPIIEAKASAKQYPKWRYKKCTDGTYWQTIKSIKRLEKKDRAVSICVPGYETYLTDFWEHNSWLAARISLWYALARKGRVITTAPNRSQVEDIIWGEIRDLIQTNPHFSGLNSGRLFFRVPGTPVEVKGITARDRDKNAIQGRHADNLMIIEDEACGITDEIDEGIRSCTTGESNRLIRFGNPVETGNPFEAACSVSSIEMPAWKHPNIQWAYEYSEVEGTHVLKPGIAEKIGLNPSSGEVLPVDQWPEDLPRYVIPAAVTIGWIEEKRVNPIEGPGSASWTARVEGQFPDSSEHSVVTKRLWDQARERYDSDPEYWDELAQGQDWVLGVDVADGGTDSSVICVRRGPVIYEIHKVPRALDPLQEQKELIDYIYKLLDGKPIYRVQIDGIGVGSPLAGALIREGIYDAFKIIWSSTDIEDPKTFINQKAEDFLKLKADFVQKTLAIAPLGKWESLTREQLTDCRVELNRLGKYQMEAKKEYKKRHQGASPDFADAIVLCHTENFSGDGVGALQQKLKYLVD